MRTERVNLRLKGCIMKHKSFIFVVTMFFVTLFSTSSPAVAGCFDFDICLPNLCNICAPCFDPCESVACAGEGLCDILGGGVKVVGGIGSGVAGSVGCLLGAGSELFCGVSQGISEIACEPCYVPRLSCCRQDDSYLR